MISIFPPEHLIKASLKISGSKSISNRLLILNEVLKTNMIPENLSDSEDTVLMLSALKQIKDTNSTTIDVHHAGTDMRFLTALLCITDGTWIITGSDRMKQRPLGELVKSLKNLGADITYLEKENFPPLKIKGKKLIGGVLEMDGSISSQYISALLLIAPTFEHGLELTLKNTIVSKPYIDMTIELLQQFNVKIIQAENSITVHPFLSSEVSPSNFEIESDWSSASYWYSVCALSPDSEIELKNFGEVSWQADSILPKLYNTLGVETVFKESSIFLSNKKRTIEKFSYDFTACPDIAQTIAVTCVALKIEADLTGLQTLKIKETDRITALKNELGKTGAQVNVTNDSLHIKSNGLKDAGTWLHISTYNDHRMAMSFAPLALIYAGISIEAPEVVDKSYPRFWEDLISMGFNVNLRP